MKIAVLVSGGVDSSVALALLKSQGFDVTAFYLKIWLEDELSFLGECPWEEDLEFVRGVTEKLGVPLEVVPFQQEYWDRVVTYTIEEVKAGRTPNPDMLCNARVKFGAFYEKFASHFDKIATGHYAQVIEDHTEHVEGSGSRIGSGTTSRFFLKKTPDVVKDQTYFLSKLSQAQLAKALFPIGGYTKSEVRELARKFNLPNAERKDSQGICFLGKIPFDKFLEYHLGKKPGKLVELETGNVLGEHDGFWYFTVGQRQGIRLSDGPWYVVKKEPESNTIYISHAEHREQRSQDLFEVGNLNWFNEAPMDGAELTVKLRHGPKEVGCVVHWKNQEVLEVQLNEKDPGIAAGQFAVFYAGEYCLGGGVIA